MINFYELKVSDRPITDKDVEIKCVDEQGNPVMDNNGKQKVEIKKDNPRARLNVISHYAIQDTVNILNKKYGLKLKKYALFGGDSKSYSRKFLEKICARVDFLNDKHDNAIETVFKTQIDYEGSKKYLNINADTIARKWANKIFQIVEKEIHKAVDNNIISSINELQELDYICLSDDCLYEINDYINSELNSIFEEIKNAKIMINRGESFSSKLNLYPMEIEQTKNYGITM